MAPSKPKAYKMLLSRISVDGQPVLIARQATLRLRNADGPTVAKDAAQPKPSGQLMEVHVDDKLLGRWDFGLLAKHLAQEMTREFQAISTDKTLIFALPMNEKPQSKSLPRGHRDSSSFIKEIRLRLGSHQDFHTAISFLCKDAGLRHVQAHQHDSSFSLKRPHSQTTFSASQPALGAHELALPRPQSAMLPPSRTSSQVSRTIASQELPATQPRNRGLSVSQDYGVMPGPGRPSRPVPTFRRTPVGFSQGLQLHQRPRLAPAPGSSFGETVSSMPRLPQRVVPLQQRSRNASSFNHSGRLQGHDGMIDQTHEDDGHVLSLRNSQQVQQRALSWQSDVDVDPYDVNTIYGDALNDELGDRPLSIVGTQRLRSTTACDTTLRTSSPDPLGSDWMSTTASHNPMVAGSKRPGSHQARPQSAMKRLRQANNAVEITIPNTFQPLVQSPQVRSQAISAQRQRSLQSSAAPLITSTSQDMSDAIESERAPSACMRCRRKHRMCDRILPTCGACASDGSICVASHERTNDRSAEKEVLGATIGVSQKSCQTSFTTPEMQDSGVQFQVTTLDEGSQTMTSNVVSTGTNTLNQISDVAVQTEVHGEGKLGILDWADLVTSIRTLNDQQVAKGARWLQRRTGFAIAYEERLLAAAMCGTEFVDGLIDLVEKAMEDSD